MNFRQIKGWYLSNFVISTTEEGYQLFLFWPTLYTTDSTLPGAAAAYAGYSDFLFLLTSCNLLPVSP